MGALSGPTTVTTNSSGQAVFTDLSIDVVGTYTLRASAKGVSSILSNLLTIGKGNGGTDIF